jgi:hypothetical protein
MAWLKYSIALAKPFYISLVPGVAAAQVKIEGFRIHGAPRRSRPLSSAVRLSLTGW